MSNESGENVIVEAIATWLQHDAKLGLRDHLAQQEKLGATERGFEYLHGQIDELFALKAAELTYCESACQAFNKVHCYKYVDDPTFLRAMDKELTAQGIPAEERRKALILVPTIIEQLMTEQQAWHEADFGLNPNMDEIRDISQPQQYQ